MILKILKNKTEQFIRLVYVNTITLKNNSVLLVEFPKSGGTWLGQLISDSLDIPFPRNEFPTLKRSLYHSHYLPKYKIPTNNHIVYLIRDGRDVIVSLYHHQLLWNDKNKLSPKDVLYHRKQVPFSDYENIKKNLYDFIQYTFEHKPSKWQQFTFMGNWYDYNQAWLKEMQKNDRVVMVKYEDLLTNATSTLEHLLGQMFPNERFKKEELEKIVERYSFKNQTKRQNGEESTQSFLRKGISGDWRNYFGKKESELFKHYTKKLLVDLGYEKNEDW